MLNSLRNRLERTAAERPVLLAFLVVVAAAAIVIPISMPFYLSGSTSFWENIVAEMHGVLFDLLVIGWFLLWLNKIAERRINTKRYREEIDDYIGWHSNEATLRIVGNIRRLNRAGVTSGFHLTEAYLEGARLADVEMLKTDLWGAQLDEASLRQARLDDANLAGASLEGTNLQRASLARADLRGANLNEADLERATLVEADARGASFVGADLQYARLRRADLRRARLMGTNLRAADLEGANLEGADLEGAHTRGANLRNVRLSGANLTGADLLGADLTGAILPNNHEDVVAMFEKARSLYGAELDAELRDLLYGHIPSILHTTREGNRYQRAHTTNGTSAGSCVLARGYDGSTNVNAAPLPTSPSAQMSPP